jgi:hypothetical protein
MQYRASTYAKDSYNIYWFEKNILGDVTAVWSDDGVKLISYVYDAWGEASALIWASDTILSQIFGW